MDQPLTKTLERYDVLDRIAVGGMAEVFLAKAYGSHGFEKTLAIKRILPELARDPEFEARFIAEAKVAVRLSHANVVQVFDFGRIGESLFIAMEYVDGLDLAAMLRKFKDEKRLVPLPAAFHIAIEIIRALDFAHGHNVVHRDVSPSNILISRAGEVKIADFGIAVAAQPHRGGGPGPKRVMGKWRYMSPEQTRGDTLDTRSDLFSAASVIHELFTGEKLFPGEEAEDIIKNIADMPIPRMSAMRNGLPSRLDEVMAGPLARKPIDRPTRPAVVLRQLIELSYESSIMATALDVAEALATVIPAKRVSGRGALDDVIRKQLSDQPATRRTAITEGKPPSTETVERNEVSTGLFRKIDLDGLARLEEVEVDNTKVAAPRARRASEQLPSRPGDSDLHALLDPGADRDRHTEIGGPPTGTVPKLDRLSTSDAASWSVPDKAKREVRAPSEAPPRRSRLGIGVLAVLAIAGGGAAVVALTRGTAPAPVVPPGPTDARVIADDRGSLLIDPEPEGATGYVEVIDQPASRQAIPPLTRAQPFNAKVPANTRIRLHLERAGYLPYDDDKILVPAGEKVRLSVRMTLAPARLAISTDPPGAQATLAGRPLGETPRTVENLTPGLGMALVLAKPGYLTLTRKIDLNAGETTTIEETLKAEQKFGLVSIVVSGVALWGEVSHAGRKLGQNRSPSGLTAFKLPVGRQVVTIANPTAKKTRTITVEVTERPQTITVVLE